MSFRCRNGTASTAAATFSLTAAWSPRIPHTNVMNVGVYRGMVADKNKIPILMWRAQHIGHHVTAWQEAGYKEMPIAVAIGWEPSLPFVGGSPVPKGICEYDVMGAIRGEPVELVKCETVDLTCRRAPRS